MDNVFSNSCIRIGEGKGLAGSLTPFYPGEEAGAGEGLLG